MLRQICSILLLLLLPFTARAAAPFGSDLYVQIKPARITLADLDRIAAAGFGGVRFGIAWYLVEVQRGKYDYNRPIERASAKEDTPALSYDTLIYELRRRKLKALVTLFDGNPIYTGGWRDFQMESRNEVRRVLPAPITSQAMNGFSRFAAQTALHFSSRYGAEPFTWLIWNEPNYALYFPPAANPQGYADLLARSCAAIRELVPAALVGGPSLAVRSGTRMELDYPYLSVVLNNGKLLKCVSVLTVHPYRPGDPESVLETYTEINALLAVAQAEGSYITIGVDEWGYSSADTLSSQDGRSAESQANRVVRLYGLNQLYGISFTNIYEWQNSGNLREDRENNFGLTAFDGTAKPGLVLFESILKELGGYRLQGRLYPTGCNAGDYVLSYDRAGARKALAWTTSENSQILIIQGPGSLPLRYTLTARPQVLPLPTTNSAQNLECVRDKH